MSAQRGVTIHIRRAKPGDCQAIASVLLESFREYEPLYTREAFVATTPGPEQVRERMHEGPVWVAVADGRVVATASIVAKVDGIYIRGMAVLPDAREGNIGRLLLEHIEAYAAERGVKHLYLSTTPFLARAIRLYEHSGFRRTDRGPSEMFGTPLFTMEEFL